MVMMQLNCRSVRLIEFAVGCYGKTNDWARVQNTHGILEVLMCSKLD